MKGFRQVVSDPTFWKEADSLTLKDWVEGESDVNVAAMILDGLYYTTIRLQ